MALQYKRADRVGLAADYCDCDEGRSFCALSVISGEVAMLGEIGTIDSSMNAGTGLRRTRVDRRRAYASLGALATGVGVGGRSGESEQGEMGDETDGCGGTRIFRPRSRSARFLLTSVLHSRVLTALRSVSL